MEATIVYWSYIGIMERKMETTGIIYGIHRVIQGYNIGRVQHGNYYVGF